MFASIVCVYAIPLILCVEWKFGHFGMLCMNDSIDAQRSKNFRISWRNSMGRKVASKSLAHPLLCDDVASKYDSKHKIQSNPALANTSVLSLSRNTRNISIMFVVFNGRFLALRSVPNNGRQPDRISVRCASTISYKHATI